jgi:hypothetical protein
MAVGSRKMRGEEEDGESIERGLGMQKIVGLEMRVVRNMVW